MGGRKGDRGLEEQQPVDPSSLGGKAAVSVNVLQPKRASPTTTVLRCVTLRGALLCRAAAAAAVNAAG